MSFKLEIKNPNGSKYWNADFNSDEERERWLNEEKTRPYWSPLFTINLINPSPAIAQNDVKVILKVTRVDGSVQESFKSLEDAEDYFLKYNWGAEERTIHHEAEILHHEEQIINHEAVYSQEVKDLGTLLSPVVITQAYDEIIAAYDEVIKEAYDEVIPCEYTKEIIEVKPVIAPISPRQLETALLSLGITYEMVLAQIALLPDTVKPIAEIAWRRSGVFIRTEQAVSAIGQMLNLSEEQLDTLWIQAEKL
jgi:hypothetical protein